MATKKPFTAQPATTLDYDALMANLNALPGASAPEEKPSAARRIGDTAVQFGQGAVTGVKMVADVFGVNNPVSSGLSDVNQALDGLLSATAQGDKQKVAQIMQEAEGKGWGEQIVAGLKAAAVDPVGLGANALGTSLPTIATMLIPGAGPAAVAARAGAGIAMGAGQGVGSVKGQIYDTTKRKWLETGATPEQAEAKAQEAAAYGGENADQMAIGGMLGMGSVLGAERALGKVLHGTSKAGPGMLGRVATSTVAETGTEAAQGGQEKYASNLALNRQGFDVDPMSGVIANATLEGAAAGPMGAVAGIPRPAVAAAPAVDPAKVAADTIRATESVPESGPMTRSVNAGTEAKAQAVEAGAPLVDEQAAAEPVPEPVDDPVRDQILALPEGARQDALRAYAVVNRDDVAKGVQQYNRKLLDRLLAENQPAPVLGESLTDTNMGAMLGGGGMAGNADPIAGMLGGQRDSTANAIDNVYRAAEGRPPMPASDAARMLNEARNRGLDLTVAEHPAGGFVIVPPAWVTPDMAAQGETRLAETIARMQQADAAPVERAPRSSTAPVDLSLPTDPVENFVGNLRTVNTPAARAYVRDFDAGRITPADVQRRMVVEQGVTPDQRIARAAAEAPATADPVADRLARAAAQGMAMPAPTDILNPSGQPFKTMMSARLAAKKAPGAEVVPVEGGFVVRPQEPVNVQNASQGTDVTLTNEGDTPEAAPVEALAPMAEQPAGPAAGVPAAGAGAVEAAGVIPEVGRNEPQTQADKAPEATESVAQTPAKPPSAPVGDEQPFAPETGTLGIPRAEMPQVPTQSHGGLVKHLNAQGIEHETTMVDAAGLKPTQAEFSPSKVEKAKEATGDRAVIVSSDGHIIDGHHQALAAAEEGKPVKAIVLDAPVEQALAAVKNSPSAQPQVTADAPVAKPINRSDVDAARQQAATAIGERIDAMTAQEVQKIAARFLPTMGVKVPVGKARIKAAMANPKVNIQAAADEVGAVLADDVKRALQADVEGRVDDAGATKNEAPTAKPAKAKDESGEGAATKSAKPIEDAGEKIGGARKDRWKERGLNLEDLDAMTESEGAELATKANVWKPDYEAMSEASEPVTAAMVKTIYDQLAAKPKKNTPEGRRQYVQMMRIVRDVLTEAKGPDAVKNAYLEIRKRAGLNTLDPKAKEAGRELLFSVYKGRSDPFVLGGADLMKAKRMVEDGFPAKGAPWKARLVVGRMEGGRGTTERGVEIYMERSAEVGTPLTREQILDGFYRVVTKDNKTAAFAATKADAEAAAATVYERDMKGKKDGKPEPVRPNLDELKRENLPKRIDRDVAADDFVRDLGFRGIEFGNWSAQDERQRILNMAYDGLMDLAEIMGVPPKAMSLNGTLGMAFGARGGGRFAAHYEPGKLVINMTKIRGGGSMAHEWAHALDHYFGELDKADAYTTQARGASGWYAEDQYVGVPRKRMERVGNEWKSVEKMRLDNLRPEMAAAFDEVMRALFSKQITKAEMVRSHELDLERTEALARNETQADLNAMYQNMAQNKRQALNELRGDPEGTMYAGRGRSDYASQAQALSGKSENGYWTRPTEMFARAFESWVFDRVTDMGARSDYLVHGVEEDRFAGGAYKGNPYPAGEERARINAAFDKLAKTIQTKETDKGVAMFSRRSASGNRLPDVVIGHKLGSLSSHPDYEAAKAGDSMAAARIASDLVDDAMVEAVRRAAGNADLIVPVVSVEATGRNKIPLAVARELADRLGSTAETEIVQADSPKRTSMDGLSRLLNPPVFDGPVTQGAAYVLVDDTVTQGGTFASLASHIRDNGGEVAGAVALTGKQYSAKLEPSSELLQQVRDRFQSVEPAFRSATGYGFDALTESEARYLVKHDDAESVRNRILAAGSERVDGGDRGLPQAFARQQGSAAPADSNSRNVATQRLVDGLKAKWTRAPEIIVARNMQDNQVPQRVRDYDAELKSQGSNGEARGFIYQGKVYLLSDELRGPQQIATVLFHEVLGHYGLRGAFGDSLTPILKQLGALRRKEVLAKAREYGMVRKNMSDADTWAALSERDRLSAAEEVLAEMAQSTPELGYVQRAIAAIRTWLRQNVPGFNRLKLTDDEIVRSYILPARGFVTRSSETPQQSLERALLAFSREGDPRSPFAQEVDAAIKAGMQGDTQSLRVQVPMGIDTPPALQLLGVDTKPVYTHRDLIAKMHFEHGVPRTALHGLDKLLSDPVMVFKSDTQPGRFVVVTNLVVGGNPVVVAVDPNGKSGRAEVVYLPSAYQKDNADRSFSRWIQAGLLRYANKEESRRLATTTKLQLPGVVQRAIGFRVDYKTEADLPATGKDAAQAPDEPQPMFSRTTDAAKAVGDTLKSVTATNIKKRAGFKFKDYLGLGLQALGRRQIVDIYGDMLPMAEYNRLVQQMEADKNEGGAEADKLVKRWAGLPDESKLADLMHEATLAQIDPAADFVDGDDKGQYLMLRRKYNLLSDDAKTVYRETRDAYKAHHAQVRAAIKERIERSEIKGERKAALLKQMDDDFFAAVKGVYFPLARFGQYVVTVKGPDGKVESVGRAETMAEADALRRNLLSAFPRSDGFTVGRVMLSKEFVASRDAVGRGFMTELYQVLDKQDMDATQRAELEDTLGQLYLSSLPDLSWAKHGIHRKGTPGFSQDARRAYAQNMFHGARYLAKLRYSDLMQDELTAMQKHVDDWREVEDFDQTSAQRVVAEMNKRHESLMNPKSNPLSTALTSFGFIFHLGLSPASAMVNLSQTALVAYPIMGAKWGFGKASAALLKASAEATRGKNDITGSLNADERAAYDEAVRAGTIDVTMAHDLAGIAQGEDAGVMWKIRPVMRWASFLFHHAERFNRQVTFVAAYRLAREAGSDHAAAFEQATKATYDGHFDYGAANRPRIMQGNVAKVLLLFKQYGQNMVYTLARNAQQAIKAETPEARAQARKALGGLLATHAMAAGVLGLPMVTTLLAAASMVGGDEDEPWDAKVALQNMLADAFGQKPAEVLAHGLSRLTPGDISGRVGLDRLIFPDVQEGLEGQRLWESAATQALGPVGGIFGGLLKGADLMSDGHYQLGLEAMLPAVLRQMVKSVRYASEGVQDKSGVVIKDEVSAAGVVGQFLGFSPSEVRLAQEGKGAVYQQDKALANRRQELLGKAARATRQKDAEARAEAMKEIERFNQKNPTRRITPLNVLQSVRNRNRRIDQAEGGIYLPKNRRDAMQAGRFAVAE